MRFSRLKIVLFTLALSAVALWLTNLQPQNTDNTNLHTKKALSYSWQATNTTVWNIKPTEPNKQSIVQAQRIAYKDNEQKSEYTKPHVEIIDSNGLSTLTSLSGESLEDTVLSFTDQVVIVQKPNDPSKNPITLTTDTINYNLQTNELTTDANVIITQYNGQTTGTGLKANLKTSNLELLSNVKGTYYPQTMQKNVQEKEQ